MYCTVPKMESSVIEVACTYRNIVFFYGCRGVSSLIEQHQYETIYVRMSMDNLVRVSIVCYELYFYFMLYEVPSAVGANMYSKALMACHSVLSILKSLVSIELYRKARHGMAVISGAREREQPKKWLRSRESIRTLSFLWTSFPCCDVYLNACQ